MTGWRSSAIPAPHRFFGTEAGNCSLSNDDPNALNNRRVAAETVLPGATLVAPYQTHSAECIIVREPWPDDKRPRADALVTDRPGLLLSILTADCAPVLLADTEAGVIGAAHAGWRGALGGVTDATLAAMLRLGARIERIAAAVGPCIARASYEVDRAFLDNFLGHDEANACFFADGPLGKPHFDLEAYVVARIAGAGVQRIEALGLDTYANPDRFFSYRRATHRIEPGYGRQISLIGLAP
ncbi:MAG: peptidoglycan editing factor PgeF [Sphingomicrobium sp.]